MFGLGQKPFLGIDIGSTSVKTALLKKHKSGYELASFGMVPLPPDTIVDGEIENPEAIVEAIKNLLKSEKLTHYKHAVFSVAGQSVIIKKITVPLMSEDDLAESIQQEAEQYIPFDIDEVNVDFQVVAAEGELPKKGQKPAAGEERQMDVLLVAAKKELIAEQSRIITEAGLKPTVVDLDVFALENGAELTFGVDRGDTVALVNIGATVTNINILERGVTAYTRDVSVGGSVVTIAIQKNMNVGFRDAESVKLGRLPEGMNKADVIRHIKTGVGQIAAELQSTFDMFHKTSESRVRRVRLSGGGAMLEGIDTLIGQELGLDCDVINPFKNLKINSRQFDQEYLDTIAPMAVVAVGLATRTLEDK